MLASTQFSCEEFVEIAGRQRDPAGVTDSLGQRRALLRIGERYERAAHKGRVRKDHHDALGAVIRSILLTADSGR